MARPRKTGLDYFPHDTTASHDTKIMAMELEHGLLGYAFYFKLLELLYAEGGLNLKNKATLGACIKTLGVTRELFEAMLKTALECALFDAETYEETGELTSESIQKRTDMVSSRRVSATETPQKPHSNPTICRVSAEFPSREKKRKGKERKEEDVARAHEEPSVDVEDPFAYGAEDAAADVEHHPFRQVMAATQSCGWKLPAPMDERNATELLETYTADWIVSAIQRAHVRGKTSWGMVRGILASWQAQGGIDDPASTPWSARAPDSAAPSPRALTANERERLDKLTGLGGITHVDGNTERN